MISFVDQRESGFPPGLWRFSPKVRVTVQDILAQEGITVNRFTDSAGLVTERSSVDPRYRRYSMNWELKL